jgi:leucine-rich repeat-containing protein 49
MKMKDSSNKDWTRFKLRYLMRYGNVKKIEKNSSVIFAELPQIPGTLVFYRKAREREDNPER